MKATKVSPARRAAFDTLRAVRGGHYASEELIDRCAYLDSRDAGLAAEVVLGTLRRQDQIDWILAPYSAWPLNKIDPAVLLAMRMAVYQTRFLERVPAYAAVNDSLQLLREERLISAVGFANAVLRKASADKKPIPEGLEVPEWLLDRWTQAFGSNTARAIARASLERPLTYQHVPKGAPVPEGATPTDIPGCWLTPTTDPRYRIQDIGSQAIIPLLETETGSSFLDVCAAPGNKTSQALEEIHSNVIACDLSFHRLKLLETLGIPLVVCDATRPLPFRRTFDRILVDAPCSGTGTLAHNPEIKWRLTPADVERHTDRQKWILSEALHLLAPGGLLVYSTCSMEPEENEEVAREVAGGRITSEIRRFPGQDPGDGFYAAVIR